MLPGALRPDLGKQERTASRQTSAGIPAAQQRDRDGPYRWTFGWRGSNADLIKDVRQCGGITETREPPLSIIKSYLARTRKTQKDLLEATTKEVVESTCMTLLIPL